jgi:copper chaperone
MVTFKVPDMHCEGCVRSLTGALRDVDAAATIEADLTARVVRVGSSASPDALAEAMRDAGFEVTTA